MPWQINFAVAVSRGRNVFETVRLGDRVKRKHPKVKSPVILKLVFLVPVRYTDGQYPRQLDLCRCTLGRRLLSGPLTANAISGNPGKRLSDWCRDRRKRRQSVQAGLNRVGHALGYLNGWQYRGYYPQTIIRQKHQSEMYILRCVLVHARTDL